MSLSKPLPQFPTFTTFPSVSKLFAVPSIILTKNQKFMFWSFTAGVAIFALLARYLRRRRGPAYQGLYRKLGGKRVRGSGIRSPNGVLLSDLMSHTSARRSDSPSRRTAMYRNSAAPMQFSDRISLASEYSNTPIPQGFTDSSQQNTLENMAPQQLGVMGMEALETAINFWEDALHKYTTQITNHESEHPVALLDAEDAKFCQSLQQILDIGYALQENCELLFLDQRSVLFRPESNVTNRESDVQKGSSVHTEREASNRSSVESFASAQDQVADLREFEEFNEVFPDIDKLPLYQSALKQLEETGIPYRKIRTENVRCGSDVEFLCKMHCIRLAFQYIFLDASVKYWFINNGRQILTDLLLFAERDPKDFLIAYENMFEFLSKASIWSSVEEELASRNVKAITFFDVVLDLILLDAFDDLDQPPSSVMAVIHNRWLSNGFKETALTTAVWSVLKAKRRRLKDPKGFLAHFYAISEHISPLLAWGFLGPDEDLRAICMFFKEEINGFIIDMFSFEKCNFSSVETLSSDILALFKFKVEAISARLAPPQLVM